jgi:tetratricopeptide (TPR) repeat protein
VSIAATSQSASTFVWHWFRTAVFVTVPPVLAVVLLEFALGAAGAPAARYAGILGNYWAPYSEPGKPAGFVRSHPRIYKIAPEPKPLFLREKPPNGFRMFCLGDSPVVGWPYDVGGFTDWLQSRLGAMLPERCVEVVNAANPGWHANETRELLRECLEHDADLILWMPGNSEWTPMNLARIHEESAWAPVAFLQDQLSRTRLVALLGRLDEAFRVERRFMADVTDRGTRFYDDDEARRVRARFVEAVRGGVGDARRAGVAVLLCTPPRNLRDCKPMCSYFASSVVGQPKIRTQWERIYEDGAHNLQSRGAAAAVPMLEEAAKIDPTPSKLQFSLGRAYQALGDTRRAREAYLNAAEREPQPTRPQQWTLDAIRSIARETSTPLVDAEARFNERSPLGLAGAELLLDNAHPNMDGQRLIGSLAIDAIRDAKIVPLRIDLDVSGLTGQRGRDLTNQQNYNNWRGLCTDRFDNALADGPKSATWRETHEAGTQLLALVPEDYEIVAIVAVLDALAGKAKTARAPFEKAMGANVNVRITHLTRYHTHETYKKLIDGWGFPMATFEASLNPAEKEILRNRIARQRR